MARSRALTGEEAAAWFKAVGEAVDGMFQQETDRRAREGLGRPTLLGSAGWNPRVNKNTVLKCVR